MSPGEMNLKHFTWLKEIPVETILEFLTQEGGSAIVAAARRDDKGVISVVTQYKVDDYLHMLGLLRCCETQVMREMEASRMAAASPPRRTRPDGRQN